MDLPSIERLIDFASFRRGQPAAGRRALRSIRSSSILPGFTRLTVISVAPLSSSVVSIGERPIVLVEHSEVGSSCGHTLLARRARSGRRDSGSDLSNSIPLTNSLPPIIFDCLEAFRDVAILGGGRGLCLVAMLNH